MRTIDLGAVDRVDVVVVRLELEAVEAQVLEPVAVADDVDRRAAVVEVDVLLAGVVGAVGLGEDARR